MAKKPDPNKTDPPAEAGATSASAEAGDAAAAAAPPDAEQTQPETPPPASAKPPAKEDPQPKAEPSPASVPTGPFGTVRPPSLRAFLTAHTERDPKGSVPLADLHVRWSEFARAVPEHPMTPAWLAGHIKGEAQISHDPSTAGGGLPVVVGLRLKPVPAARA